VLHIDSGRELRGGQWQVLYLLSGLAETGCASTLLVRSDSALFGRAASEGIDVRPGGLGAVARLARSFDLIHAHDARSHALALVAPGRPLVVARRVAFPVRGSPLSRIKYARAARYIAVSKYVRETLRRAGVPDEKIAVVYDGVPLPERSRGDGPVVAPAFDDPRKGTALVKEASARAGIEVHFSANLAEDLSRARLFVYITHQEGLGSAALQAMAAGVPVIASRVGGLPEAVEDGVTGVLVENSAGQVAAAIRRLLGDGSLAAEMGARGRERVAQRFSVAHMVEGTVREYREALAWWKR
jgi:glycosyltransferase involved in cell wall biosynthesis